MDAMIVRHRPAGVAAGGGLGRLRGDQRRRRQHEHPTQALLDAYTIVQSCGSLKGCRVAIVGTS